jgi:anti-anti-sigma factor
LADVHFAVEDQAVVVRLSGEVDGSNAESIGQALDEAVPNHASALVLDLSEMHYLDSAGIRLIFRLHERLRSHGQVLRVVIPSGSPVHDALRLAGASNQVGSIETVEAALSELSGRTP